MVNQIVTNLRKYRKIKVFINFLVLIMFIFFLEAGHILIVNQTPKRADIIIVLSGGKERVQKAAKLYNDGYAPYVLLSNSKEIISSAGNMVQTSIGFGIPAEVILTENEALSTYQNAKLTHTIMEENNFNSAIVVSSDYHMRRVKFLFDFLYKKSGIELTYVGSDSGYDSRKWWSTRYSRENTFNEYMKMIGNAFGYNGPEAKNSLKKIKRWIW